MKRIRTISFERAFAHDSDATITEKALATVREYSYRTTAELASRVNSQKLSGEQLHKRLSELYKKGLITKADVRPCTVTGKRATTWAPIFTALLLLCLTFPAFADEDSSSHFDCGHVGRECRTHSVPEPGSIGLLGAGLVAVAHILRRR